jgi:hypothetical protein
MQSFIGGRIMQSATASELGYANELARGGIGIGKETLVNEFHEGSRRIKGSFYTHDVAVLCVNGLN